LPATKNMDMKMGHGFSSIGTMVDHYPEALSQTFLLRKLANDKQEVTEKRLIGR